MVGFDLRFYISEFSKLQFFVKELEKGVRELGVIILITVVKWISCTVLLIMPSFRNDQYLCHGSYQKSACCRYFEPSFMQDT